MADTLGGSHIAVKPHLYEEAHCQWDYNVCCTMPEDRKLYVSAPNVAAKDLDANF